MVTHASARLRALVAGVALTLGLGLAAGCTSDDDSTRPAAPSPSVAERTTDSVQIAGTVRTEDDQPVFGARVSLGSRVVVSDSEGRFFFPRPAEDGLVTAALAGAYGYAPLDADTGRDVEVVVHPSPTGAQTLRFGGDVRTGTSVLPRSATQADYDTALDGVAPLLRQARLGAVTLASPLVADPWSRDGAASSSQLAPALAKSGVDVVSLATDRVLDAGPRGLASTALALRRAGVSATGAGEDRDAAWTPAVLSSGMQKVAYLGCQMGSADAAWAAGRDRPGAAVCSTDELTRRVKAATRKASTVAVFIRGDRPYSTQVWKGFSDLVFAAIRGGATVIVGGGHVSGEVWGFGDAMATQSLGDLMTDAGSTAADRTMLLRVDVDDYQATSAGAEPLVRHAGVPSVVGGVPAAETARQAAADNNDGPLVLSRTAAVVGTDRWRVARRTVPASQTPAGVVPLRRGWWLPQDASEDVSSGIDLTPTGDFEDVDADPSTDGALLMRLDGGASLVSSDTCAGERSVRLDASDGAASVEAAGPSILENASSTTMSYTARREGSRDPEGTVELAWFDADGEHVATTSQPLRAGSSCAPASYDTDVPSGAVTVRPVVRLSAGAVTLDDLRLVAWMPGHPYGRRWSFVRLPDGGALRLAADAAASGWTPPGPIARRPGDDS